MKDTKNLKNKIKKELPKKIKEAQKEGDDYSAKYWTKKLEDEKERLEMRKKNRNKNQKQYKKDDIKLMEYMIINNSWWDTVDLISTKVSGTILLNNPERINEFASKWNLHPNMWINRMGILFQLKYKQKTNSDILFHHFLSRSDYQVRARVTW